MSAAPVSSYIDPKDKIPVGKKCIMGAAGTTEYLATNLTTNTLWMPVFNIGYGISPAVLGIILMVFRFWDAFADPIMGHITDNTRSRWGRRRPYIVIGGVLVALVVPMLFRANPEWSSTVLTTYLLVAGLLLFTVSTFWAMPYHSLMMELTPSYDERTRLVAVAAIFNKTSALLGGWVLALIASDLFADPVTGEPDIIKGARYVGLGLGVIILCVATLPGLFVKERFGSNNPSGAAKRESFWVNLKETFHNKPLWLLVGIVFLNLLGLISTGGIGFYVNTYYINSGAIADAAWIEGWKQTAMFLVGIGSIPLWTMFAARFDKKLALATVLIGTFLGHALNFFCLRPDMPYLQIVPAVFWSGVSAAVWLLVPSMKMDVADYDEYKTGRRREGSLNAVLSWFIKMAIALGIGLSGILLQLTGFDVNVGEIQPPEVLERMVTLYIMVPIIIWIPALIFIGFYPLNREKMAEIRTILEVRRGAIPAVGATD